MTSNPADTTTSAYRSASYGGFTASNWVFFNGQTRPFGSWEVPTNGVINSSHALQLVNATGAMQGGSITNVTSAVNVTGDSAGATLRSAYVGGLVGLAANATIARASGVITAGRMTGGPIGLLFNSALTGSSASGAVNGRAGKSGGLVGSVDGGTVTGGSSTGSVNGTAGGPGYGSISSGGRYNGTNGS